MNSYASSLCYDLCHSSETSRGLISLEIFNGDDPDLIHFRYDSNQSLHNRYAALPLIHYVNSQCIKRNEKKLLFFDKYFKKKVVFSILLTKRQVFQGGKNQNNQRKEAIKAH